MYYLIRAIACLIIVVAMCQLFTSKDRLAAYAGLAILFSIRLLLI
ncbi:hypothetical protein kac65v162_gp125 [Nodularia phage vB_NspS-kac65v162]|uniref:Uncharacterized protein n=6 Tax=Ravarandavirus TaxID=2843444 RepID=A0A482MLM2_9CAUD|nr:hypothetical protein HWA92_gp114 [Nodularia phage vB_NpeS-2AV2]YP_009844728.1 hypothetical protein HWC12_gp192 [Nodularia phage vB_NspS-kac65v151]YP_009844936.1 hypothetical protein HWC13_gp184 [Nodularia phage vB_NspS-kac68v161]QBQ73363.1 hypothetical protein kac65v161_gp125 [Nodularia phage vB_NspS-kac65v161]QBQ73569.1 hypothetical protein kac65v162_gp125 [Nodularia phage vB_NspS-kac65v162]QBQ73973.1 hypothetical protein kac68v162_gp125 [Nodularia phage vB_NspS-kac68v162]ALY07566.1 hypot